MKQPGELRTQRQPSGTISGHDAGTRARPHSGDRSGRNEVQSVTKGLRILFELAGSGGEISVGELAGRVGMPRTTVYRLTDTLIAEGLVVRLSSGFAITPKCVQLMSGVRIPFGVRQIVEPYLHRLVDRSGETASAHVRAGLMRSCIAEVEGLQGVRWARGVGFTAPVWSGAVGHVFLGACTDEQIDEILGRAQLTVTAPGSVTDLAELKRLAIQAREQGWSSSRDEVVADACAIAAPLPDHQGNVATVLSLYAPSTRYRELLQIADDAVAIIREAAAAWAAVSGPSDAVQPGRCGNPAPLQPASPADRAASEAKEPRRR